MVCIGFINKRDKWGQSKNSCDTGVRVRNSKNFYSDPIYSLQSSQLSTGGGIVSETNTEIDFEKALAELEQLVETMEKGDLTLEDSLKHFERGVTLTRACQKALTEAEQKVRILTRDNESAELAEFEADSTDEG